MTVDALRLTCPDCLFVFYFAYAFGVLAEHKREPRHCPHCGCKWES